jgi:malonyl-CoA O-methyltransferase
MKPALPDSLAARRAFERAAASAAGGASEIAREIERRMADRLDYVRVRPRRVLDAGCGVGDGMALLRRRYPQAQIVGVDFAYAMARRAWRSRPVKERVRSLLGMASLHCICADMAWLPLIAESCELVWSNLALAWVPDPMASFREFHRVLAPGGLLMFSTYGPDTLKELKKAFSGVDRHLHTLEFLDMHDLGDMLVAAGFSAPVMDMEFVTLTYSDVATLVRDLRDAGETNVMADRRRGLLGRKAWGRVLAAYEAMRRDERVPATLELVYGHAWKGKPRSQHAAKVAHRSSS